MYRTKGVQRVQKAYFSSITIFENRGVYNVENTVEPDRPQTTTKHMCTANWIPMAQNTHLEYAIFLLFHCNKGWAWGGVVVKALLRHY
jgi:hypothetical protein